MSSTLNTPQAATTPQGLSRVTSLLLTLLPGSQSRSTLHTTSNHLSRHRLHNYSPGKTSYKKRKLSCLDTVMLKFLGAMYKTTHIHSLSVIYFPNPDFLTHSPATLALRESDYSSTYRSSLGFKTFPLSRIWNTYINTHLLFSLSLVQMLPSFPVKPSYSFIESISPSPVIPTALFINLYYTNYHTTWGCWQTCSKALQLFSKGLECISFSKPSFCYIREIIQCWLHKRQIPWHKRGA